MGDKGLRKRGGFEHDGEVVSMFPLVGRAGECPCQDGKATETDTKGDVKGVRRNRWRGPPYRLKVKLRVKRVLAGLAPSAL